METLEITETYRIYNCLQVRIGTEVFTLAVGEKVAFLLFCLLMMIVRLVDDELKHT
jgi:hypothetical protein